MEGPRPAQGEGCHEGNGLPGRRLRRPGQGLPTCPEPFSQTRDVGSWHSPNDEERAIEKDKYRTLLLDFSSRKSKPDLIYFTREMLHL